MSDNADIIRTAICGALQERTDAGDSQAAIARAAGVHPVALSRYKCGTKDLTGTSISKLMHELDLHVLPGWQLRDAKSLVLVATEMPRDAPEADACPAPSPG